MKISYIVQIFSSLNIFFPLRLACLFSALSPKPVFDKRAGFFVCPSGWSVCVLSVLFRLVFEFLCVFCGFCVFWGGMVPPIGLRVHGAPEKMPLGPQSSLEALRATRFLGLKKFRSRIIFYRKIKKD